MMIKVVLVDDHVIVRSGFAQLLTLESDMEVVGQFSSAAEARAGLPGLDATVCILDIVMPEESGLSLLEDLPSGIATVMLSAHDSACVVEKALSLGAKGFLSKRCSPEELVQAVRTVVQGGCYLTSDVALNLVSKKHDKHALDTLTKREYQISELLATGLDVKSVAVKLGLSHKTVHVHRANAMDKLSAKNNVELAKYFSTETM